MVTEITPEKFNEFLAWLNPEKEKAGEEYERLRFRLITFFIHRNSAFPEELADETINRIILKINVESIENKTAYVYGAAGNIFLESLRKVKKQVNLDEINLSVNDDFSDKKEFSDECLEKCLNELESENRNIILEYFSKEKQAKIELHKQLSQNLKMSQEALRMRIVRIKQKLKICLQKCLA